MTDQPEECDCCGSETDHLTFYEGRGTLESERWLCEFCEATIAGSRYQFNSPEYDHIVIDIARILNVLVKNYDLKRRNDD
jgi:hypothetical protein